MKNAVTSTDLQRMTQTELRREIIVHRTEYAAMRMGVETQKEKNHALFKSKRREIARMETALTAMKHAGQKEKTAVPVIAVKDSPKKASQKAKKPVKVSRSK